MSKTNFKDIAGQKFGRLIAMEYVGKNKSKHSLWLCKCDCGGEKIVELSSLTLGRTKSCGCLDRENLLSGRNRREHGMHNTRPYRIWKAMKNRCNNPNTDDYKYWGARGITVCDEWQNSFKSFYDHVSVLPHFNEDGYSLDRIDVNGNYEPGNVRWATAKEQNENKRKK